MRIFWEKIIKYILINSKSRSILEIGAEKGEHSLKIVEYCKAVNGKLIIVDPYPLLDFEYLNSKYKGYYRLINDYSLNVLPKLNKYDAVLIDGDHNWYTVYNELKQIERTAIKTKKFPIVFLHDIEWPYGRRDMYYFPGSIPPKFRQPFAKKGIAPGHAKLIDSPDSIQEGDKIINSELYNAIYEGGEKNGVLTAVEDFLRESKIPLSFHRVKSHHGLGILTVRDRQVDNFINYIIKTSGL